ncbi:Exodeoxyribonuclease 7 large subunit [Paraburkholderia domus]|jgi:exodeoxyribonuclease VII, large subunit|uniref:Exodeoxyribonuclease 7 large subunit n=1 Tax=Paraburkholderia domus TaxID=2793075 RepID=A0A9N8MNA0_9BURK|nr:exodeoxyribonuclease VII large subunit [Paraburkholderia domus]MBK5047399.1 exodeoxyribonuclease VII large subunit [Burkholderia sp. R-70006]MBK5059258.1 exodeoxyribonuclease VII large subunit [Burkholderia sp. R-70199]MBK5086271.1 exodeoxyribonuclease VII large subunit [Burkholderia sp. R-69927]MBK5163340.1 exodeoxyribonuclease VII large subunit [Burkholderia sp. R-70211]MBK5179142.1 exodeoxyribonuclease VII large subunit [Burkholderia sp. R-69749]MCI0145417.1 exodeoxyribonuclease VII lar
MNPESPFSSSATPGGEVVVPVSALNRAIGTMLERSFPLVWVAGEVSNFTRAASGHWYFSIKDAQAQMRCVMFRGRAQYAEFTPREGDRIEVRALVTMYEPRGELQLNVEAVRRTGQGRLYEAFLKLKAQLEAEGLFAAERKRALPAHPRAIGIVTSLQAAALRDVLTTLSRRAPHIPVIVYPAPVQGAGVSAKLAAMVDAANARREVDVLIVCRGGGSIEDLWAFNEEVLARAIAESAIPVVSGVGHETDFTIADFAADVRAPTPTGAAELVSPQRVLLLRELDHRHATLARGFGRMMERRAQQLDWLARRLVSPAERLARQRTHLQQLSVRLASAGARPVRDARARFSLLQMRWQRWRPDLAAHQAKLGTLSQRLDAALLRQHERQSARIDTLAARLEVLSPQRTLERGYAAVLDAQSGRAVRAPSSLKPGRRLTVHLAEGAADIALADVQPRLTDGF